MSLNSKKKKNPSLVSSPDHEDKKFDFDLHEFEKRSFIGVNLWFLKRNFSNLCKPTFIALFFVISSKD